MTQSALITKAPVLYLDFDGPLHHDEVYFSPERGVYLKAPPEFTLFQHAPVLEKLLAPYPELRIVLATSWCLQFGLEDTKARMPAGLAWRVTGETRRQGLPKERFSSLDRGAQIEAHAHLTQPPDWFALDNDAGGWSQGGRTRLVLTDDVNGLGVPAVQAAVTAQLRRIFPATN